MGKTYERLKYIIAVVLYGTIGMFLRYVSLPSEIVAMCRGLIGSLFIFIYMKLIQREIDSEAIRRNRKWLILGGICLGLNWVFLFSAYIKTTVAIASLCNYMAPVIVILIAPFVLHEPLDKRKLPYVFLAFIGIVLVSGVWEGTIGSVSGIIMGLMGALCFVGIIICNRKLKDISPLDKSFIQLAISVIVILPFVLIKNIGRTLDVDLISVLISLLVGIINTGLAYVFYFSGMSILPVHEVAVLGYLEPVVSVLCSVFFLHEHMGIMGWIGTLMIIGAALCIDITSSSNQANDI
ncbi:MAG: EamA family transporter [Clostridia bacterium]|nr:EamA family transporter [Clostridia bacterium]